jgi:hypothetical protein
MRLLMMVLVSCFLIGGAYCAPSSPQSHKMTSEQVEAVVRLAFDYSVRHFKHRGSYGFDGYPDNFDERYYHLDLWGSGWSPPGIQDEGMLDSYAVNKLTGEVWDTFLECHVVHFPALTRMQNDIRRRDGLSAHEPPGTPHRGEKPRDC